ncbi:MAG TPA: hypothetical protein VK181_19350 [Rhizobium sp.]|nr:hypothetical protein [Rhizobium sp.]
MDFRAYLRDQRLFTDEPYEQECIREKERITEPPEGVIFDNFYRSPKEKIYCHICGSHRHLNGITGLLRDGSRILFGSTCAKDFFGSEVMQLCAGDLKRKTKKAFDKFLILEIANSVEPVESWLHSYRQTIHHIERSWTDIHLRYERSITNLLDHLRRNNGRLLDKAVITFGGMAHKQEQFEHHKIITHISAPEAIPYLKQVSQRLALVDAFIHAVRTVRTAPNEQLFSNLAALYQKTLDAATDVDACFTFTSDFFSPEKLTLLSNWISDQRRARLGNPRDLTKQDLRERFIRIMGIGVEKPRLSLADAIRSTDMAERLQQRSPTSPPVGEVTKSRS